MTLPMVESLIRSPAGERTVSMHHADDETIVIKQNQCFKEIVQEIKDYEQDSGSKMNYKKTKGLWLGSLTHP